MYYALITTDGYFSGSWSSLLISCDGYTTIQCNSIPTDEIYTKTLAYKWDTVNLVWVYDSDKYAALLAAEAAAAALAWLPTAWTTDDLQSKIEYIAMMQGITIYDTATDTTFKKVTAYFNHSYWTNSMIKNSVVKGWITSDEYKTITGLDYVS